MFLILFFRVVFDPENDWNAAKNDSLPGASTLACLLADILLLGILVYFQIMVLGESEVFKFSFS